MPQAVIDKFIQDNGVRGSTPWAELEYWDVIDSHLLDYMHIVKNVGVLICLVLWGQHDTGAKDLAALEEFGLQPELWREDDPERPHWPVPASVKHAAFRWCQRLKLPRAWGTGHRYAFTEKKSRGEDDDHVGAIKRPRVLKTHNYHVLVGSGALAMIATWPRLSTDPPKQHVARFVGQFTSVHRQICSSVIDDEVRM